MWRSSWITSAFIAACFTLSIAIAAVCWAIALDAVVRGFKQ